MASPAMRAAISSLSRYIVTPEVAKHRIFRWAPGVVLPDCKLMVIARNDDTTFGILHSRFHQQWSLRLGMTLEDRPTYTPSTTFESFPFPEGLTPKIPAFLRTLATPEPMTDWSLTSLKEKLIKIGAKVVSHGRYVAFQIAEVAIPRQMFQEILRLIAELRPQPPPASA
jgi:Transposase DDE domain group 1